MVKEKFQINATIVATFLTMVFGLASAASANHLAEVGQALSENRQKWDDLGIEDYDFDMQQSCFSFPACNQPILVHVRSGQIDSVESSLFFATPDKASFLTIDELFDYAQQSLDSHVYNLTATFDATFGYPTNLMVDNNEFAADDGGSITVYDLRVVSDSNRIPGNANGDEIVDRADLSILLAHYGTANGMAFETGDFNANGAASLSDLAILQSNLGYTSTENLTAVPEPSAIVLMMLAMAASGLACRRRDRP